MVPPAKVLVSCRRRGCTGSCPAWAVERGFQEGRKRLVCRVCTQPFLRPDPSLGLRGGRSAANEKPNNRRGQDKGPSWQDMAKLQQKIQALEAKQPKPEPADGRTGANGGEA